MYLLHLNLNIELNENNIKLVFSNIFIEMNSA